MASSQTLPWEYLLPDGPFTDPLISDHAVLCVMGENGKSRPWSDPLLCADGLDDDGVADDDEDDLDDLDEFDDEEDEDEDFIADEEEEDEDEDWDDEDDEELDGPGQ